MIILEIGLFLLMAIGFGFVAMDYRGSIERFRSIISFASFVDKENIHGGFPRQMAVLACLFFCGMTLASTLAWLFSDK
ncbi:hypothetical protein GCM10009716_47990 [Streptomyces sodiiphilus]|uniref:Uncharacterized protein n=1 Tax=Streptomyces sodiiphilus TaxID=226217 RepID=A0ABN2PWN4_9ACTN